MHFRCVRKDQGLMKIKEDSTFIIIFWSYYLALHLILCSSSSPRLCPFLSRFVLSQYNGGSGSKKNKKRLFALLSVVCLCFVCFQIFNFFWCYFLFVVVTGDSECVVGDAIKRHRTVSARENFRAFFSSRSIAGGDVGVGSRLTF